MRISTETILANIDQALADHGSLECNGQVIEDLIRQFKHAGIKLTTSQIRDALDSKAEVCPSTFAPMPYLSKHYGGYGPEYRFRPSTERQEAMSLCRDAIYAETDKLDRTPNKVVKFKDGSAIKIETIRPRAYAKAMGHLRVRWAMGDFTVPHPSVIQKWIA